MWCFMMRLLCLVIVVSMCFNVTAAPSLHLLFHMGMGLNGNFFVGGTLENKGDEDTYKGYIVITPLTKDCYPLTPQLWQFGSVSTGQKLEFKIPVEGLLNGYKLDVVHAVDSYGNKLDVVDDTTEILASKLPSYIEKCNHARVTKKTHKQSVAIQ